MNRRDFIKLIGVSPFIKLGDSLVPTVLTGTKEANSAESLVRVLALTGVNGTPPGENRTFWNVLNLYTVDFNTESIKEVWQAKGLVKLSNSLNGFSSLVIADVDKDGRNELITCDSNRLYLWRVPEQEPITAELEKKILPYGNFNAVSVGYARNDGKQIIFAGIEGKLHMLEYDGKKLYRIAEPKVLPNMKDIHNIRIDDADNDGSPEIVIGGGGKKQDPKDPKSAKDVHAIIVYTLTSNNELMEKARIISPYNDHMSLRIADALNNGRNQVITTGRKRYGYSTETPENQKTQGLCIWQYNPQNDLYEPIIEDLMLGIGPEAMNVGDVNKDGLNEIIVGTFGTYRPSKEKSGLNPPQIQVLQYQPTGKLETLWKSITDSGAHYEGIIIGDLDKDRLNEFVSLMPSLIFKFDKSTKNFKSIQTPIKANYAAIGDVFLSEK